MRGRGAGDPIEAERVRRAARARLFGDTEGPLRLGRFELRERIGEGGMGVVYAAHDPELHRTVAVKLLTEDGASLLDEARAMAAVRHPSLVAVHDVGTWEGHVFLAMERVEGPSLRAWLQTPRRPAEIVRVFAGAGRALAALHAAKLIHRDFKPDNVVVDADGRARLVDFGLARREGTEADLAGTPAYLAPELVQGAPPSAASDQYAFATAMSACELPGRVRRLLARGRDPDPGRRWPSMTALVDAIEHDPGRAWRRGLAVAAVAGGLGVSVALIVGPDRDPAGCDDGRARLAGVWDDARRAALAAGFDASKLRFAAALRPGVEARLDAYVDAWKTARVGTCRATMNHTQSDDLLDRRMICLDRKLTALDATVDLLAAGDPKVVERGRILTDALPPIDACADVAAVTATVPPPDDPDARARIAALEPRRAEGVALTAAGKLDDAIAALDGVVTEARAIGYGPFVAEALLALGTAQNTGNRDGAHDTLFEAATAAQAAGAIRVFADAAILTAGAHVFHEEWREAHTWVELADASLKASGDDPRQRARWHGQMMQLTFNQGDYDQALDHGRRAVAILVEAGDTDTTGYAKALTNLGMVLARTGQRDEARAKLNEALALRERLLGPDHPELSETLNSLAIIDENFEDYESAYQGYHRAYEIAVAANGAESVLAARYLDYQAAQLFHFDRGDEAMAMRLEAMRIREKLLPPDSTELADSYHNLGVTLLDHGQLDEAERRLEQARAIITAAFGEEHVETGSCWLNLADISLRREDYAQAIDRERHAVHAFEAVLGPDAAELVYPLTGEGIALMYSERLKEAVPPLERAVALAEKSDAWPSQLPRARFYLAIVKLYLGDKAGARRDATQARAEYAALDMPDKLAEVDAFLAAN